MTKKVYYLSIFFYFSLIALLIIGSLGSYEGLYATNGKVIETFELGPINSTKKQIVKVKTHYEWSLDNPCPCEGENPPCVKTFLNKDLPQEESYDVQSMNEFDQNSEKYQGGSLVPTVVENASVRIITIPFCRDSKKSDS